MEEQKKPNLWLMRIIIVNLIAVLFVIFKHENFDQAMHRMIFVNIFSLVLFLIIDSLAHLALRYLKKKQDDE